MIRVNDINPDFEMEIEFLNLSNLAYAVYREQVNEMGINLPGARLLEDGEIDRCESYKDDASCTSDPECFPYYQGRMTNSYERKCASLSRKFDYRTEPTFSHKNIIAEVQRYRQLFGDQRNSADFNLFFMSYGGNQIPIYLYYRLVRSERTEINYLMFSSGMVIYGPDVLQNLKEWAMQTIQKVKEHVVKGSRICLCGHSMGATAAMAIAFHWIATDPDYFNAFVTVVALGPMNMFNPEDGFRDNPNIRAYLSCIESGPNTLSVDPFCLRGHMSKVLYSPVDLIVPPQEIHFDVTDLKVTSMASPSIDYPDAIAMDGERSIIIDQKNHKIHQIIVYIHGILQLAAQDKAGNLPRKKQKAGHPTRKKQMINYFKKKKKRTKHHRTSRR
jgi:hypothetical protein